MQKAIIKQGKIALVFKSGNYKRTLEAGNHWLSFGERIKVYDLTQPFDPPVALPILEADANLKRLLIVLEVKEGEVAVAIKDGFVKKVLAPGRYIFWKGISNYEFKTIDLQEEGLIESCTRNELVNWQLMPFVQLISVEAHELGLLYLNGVFQQELAPGSYAFWKNNVAVSVQRVDLRTRQLEISGQEMLTQDKAALRVTFFAQYRVTDVRKALSEFEGYERQLYIRFQLALREFVGTQTLDELLDNKEQLTSKVAANVASDATAFGLEIGHCGIRDIILPGEVKEIMNRVLVAQKTAQANTIMRREETASTRSLLNTAKLMEDNTMLFKLKEMEYVEKIAEKINSISLSGGNQVVDQLREIFSVEP